MATEQSPQPVLTQLRRSWRLASSITLIVFCSAVVALTLLPTNTWTWQEWAIAAGAAVTAGGLALYVFGIWKRLTAWSYWSACSVATAALWGFSTGHPPGVGAAYLTSTPLFLLAMSLLAAASHVLDGPSRTHLFDAADPNAGA